MKSLFLKSIYFIFPTALCLVEANRGWGGGGHGNRWKQGGSNNPWRQQNNYHSKYGNNNYGHNNNNYWNTSPYNNFNNHDESVSEELTPPQEQTYQHNNNQQYQHNNPIQQNSGHQTTNNNKQPEDPLVSFSHRPAHKDCVKPSMGGSSMFELKCIFPETTEDSDCTSRGGILPEGALAMLKCKAPYYSEKNEARLWVCEDGVWKGEFKSFSCSFGPIPSTTPQKPSVSKFNQTSNQNYNKYNQTSNQKPIVDNNKYNHNDNSYKPPYSWNTQTQNNNYEEPIKPKVTEKPAPVTDNLFPGLIDGDQQEVDKYNHNGNNNYKPPYSWNSQNNNYEEQEKPKVPAKPVSDSIFPGLFDDEAKQAEDEGYSSLPGWKQPVPEVDQPSSWQSGGWSAPTTTAPTTTTTTTTTTTSRPLVVIPSSSSDDWSSVLNQTQGRKCPSLSKRTGVQLECLSKSSVPWDPASFLVSQTDCKAPQVVGTEATYKCQQYYEASAGLTIQYRKCKDDGTWTGGENGFSCALECGKANSVGKIPLITSGEPTYKAQWPWHTALFYREVREDPTQHAYICGGTLVSRRAILTAAHCVTEYVSTSLKNLNEFRIDLGRYERTIEDEFVQTFSAETIIPHPSYNPYIFDSDIAIIILKSTVTVGFHVRPICYPQTQNSAFEDLHLSDGSVGTVVGFGKNENDKLSDILQMAKLKVVNQQQCAESLADTASGSSLTKSTTFCAGLKNGTNVCSGDSGGGIYFPINTGTSSRWYLQGLVSVGIGSQDGSKRCDPTRYSIFTRISPYADWIVRILSEYDAL